MLSLYDAVLSALHAGVVIHAADTRILEANDRARALLGLQDLEGRLATDPHWVFMESDRSPMAVERFPVMQVIASGEPVRGLLLIVRPPEGSEAWLEVNALPVLADDGTIEQIAVTFIDVTDARHAQEEQAGQTRRLELVLAASRLGLWDWNMVTGETVFDTRWADIVGYRLQELEPISIETWKRLTHPDDLAASDALIARCVRGLAPAYDIEVRMRHRDGHWVWIRDRGEIVEWTPDGRPLRMTGIHEDISRQRADAERLAAAEEESRHAFDRSSVATCLVSNDGRLTRVNPAICDLLARSEAELLSMGFLDVTHPDDAALGADLVRDLLVGRRPSLRVTKRYVTGDGRVIWGDVTVSAVFDASGAVRHRIAQILDVTAEHALRESLLEAQRIAHVGSWTMDSATNHVTWSEEMYLVHGLDPTCPVPDFTEHDRFFTPASWQELSTALAVTQESGVPYELELQVARPDGSHGWMLARGEALYDGGGGIVGLQGVALDITDRRVASDALQVLATHDPLTGLANRAALVDELTRALSAGRRSGRTTAVLMVDLDRFKNVNDTLGHGAGDDLLIAAARRLEIEVRAGDLVARPGGDEFVVVMRDLDDPTEAARAALRLVHAFRRSFSPGGAELFTTASIGVAIGAKTSDAGDLLREADTAMYAAKEAGRDRVSLFNQDLRAVVAARLAIEGDLRHALERGQLAVWYQPEVDLTTGAVIAVEALLRWHHPDGSVWTADRFIDIAEDTGLILDIGDWVLRQACAQAAAWTAARPDRPITVRVNASALQVAEAGLLDAIDDALAASGLTSTQLCMEITETALLRQTATASENLNGIHERGIALAVDDFGTGYASLTYLHQYPIDVIKIDRSFVTHSTTGRDHRLLAGIIALAKTLGITITAEGVEHPDQANRLRQMGCPSAQGWLYSEALPPEDVTPLLDHTYPCP